MAFAVYRSVTIDESLCGSADTAHYPFYFNSTDNGFKSVGNGGDVQNGSGFDLAFYADSALTTLLDFEIEFWSATTGQVIAWIRIPSLSASVDTVIYVAYGDAAVVATLANPTGVWSDGGSNYYGQVIHGGDGSSLNVNDSTANANHGTNHSATAVAGKVHGGVDFASASSAYVEAASAASLNIGTGAMTCEFWLKENALVGVVAVVDKRNTVSPFEGWLVFFFNFSIRIRLTSASDEINVVWGNSRDAFWHHYVFTYDGSGAPGGVAFYGDGGLVGAASSTGSLSATADSAAPLDLGGTAGLYLNGTLDEFRMSKGVARDANYARSSFNNQSDPATFYALGSPAAPASGALRTRVMVFG